MKAGTDAAVEAATRDHRPVYIRIAEALRARILSGHYPDRIDGELPLAREWQVSRRTIQQALGLLVNEGLLLRRHGMGTFVSPNGVEKRYRAITSITEGIAAQGLTPEFRILSSHAEAADSETAEFFGLGESDRVYRHRRLISANGRVLALADTRLNLALLEGLELSHLDGSLYDALRRRFNRTIVKAEDRYMPAVAEGEIPALLGLKRGSPILTAVRRAQDQTGHPIELTHISMQPVPLDISIRHADLLPEESKPDPEWAYTVGFGSFTG
ncbi:MAG: GntR family transcriptional regulator [Mesorhizobium sp.]